MKYVITGPPCSGKTTIINILKSFGFTIEPEAARYVIEKHKRHLSPLSEESIDLQREILRLQLSREKKQPNNISIFLDRGVPDVLSYLTLIDGKYYEKIYNISYKRYDKVFFMNKVPIVNDELRVIDPIKITILENELRKIYTNLGYNCIDIPAFELQALEVSIAKRLMIIFNHIF